ncbi:hypothetical protein [Agrobacterium sp. SUL3]|uniref:hypothetical protein n=1 Tax=Agrobacterium sp. SUL3 TaxID=1701910 RepID=UPI00069C8D0C|nr:hypothetical protein [Agrobacterium sp. SUL3]KNY30911.1 hypothetical protein AKG12_27285 [Agrobacterium sp. SUL3]
MTIFDAIPNKKPIDSDRDVGDVWPEYGNRCELNQFFRQFVSAEGWLGEGYLAIWSKEEISKFRRGTVEAYGDKFRFFASDGGGTQFGFYEQNGEILYVSAPDIGSISDMRILGNWSDFLNAVSNADYI